MGPNKSMTTSSSAHPSQRRSNSSGLSIRRPLTRLFSAMLLMPRGPSRNNDHQARRIEFGTKFLQCRSRSH
ncbi:hypothetical protein Agabi119p4_10599 [Agaricus bisporus var. burnettii]|uniref:Uncharacterized protein n=1 Tax=Agaricus bisporus var. burnettii TaxID=192524 RepID=A0A8H7C386_AGABI|nr:hypothetical protein Agabi119p4_10599 [Agaricus bisporus var. burnettii]